MISAAEVPLDEILASRLRSCAFQNKVAYKHLSVSKKTETDPSRTVMKLDSLTLKSIANRCLVMRFLS